MTPASIEIKRYVLDDEGLLSKDESFKRVIVPDKDRASFEDAIEATLVLAKDEVAVLGHSTTEKREETQITIFSRGRVEKVRFYKAEKPDQIIIHPLSGLEDKVYVLTIDRTDK